MENWTAKELEMAGYRVENAKITSVDLSMADHGVLTLEIVLEGAAWGCVYGGYVLGHGYLGAKEFSGSGIGLESIMRIMDVVGVERFNDMKGKYVRVAVEGISSPIKIIGNVINNKWFDIDLFFKEKTKNNE